MTEKFAIDEQKNTHNHDHLMHGAADGTEEVIKQDGGGRAQALWSKCQTQCELHDPWASVRTAPHWYRLTAALLGGTHTHTHTHTDTHTRTQAVRGLPAHIAGEG